MKPGPGMRAHKLTSRENGKEKVEKMGFKIAQKVYEVLPTGDYPAEIIQVDLTDGQFGQQLKFSFDLLGKNQTLWGWASASFTTKSKLYGWTRAAFGGKSIPANYGLDTDHLIGRRVLLTVVVARKEDGTEFNKIQDVRPYLNGNGNGVQPVPITVASDKAEPQDGTEFWDSPMASSAPEAPPVYMDGVSF